MDFHKISNIVIPSCTENIFFKKPPESNVGGGCSQFGFVSTIPLQLWLVGDQSLTGKNKFPLQLKRSRFWPDFS